MNGRRAKKGSVLIITMWALSFLTIFAISMGTDSRAKMSFVDKVGRRDKLRFIAEAGIEKAITTIAAKKTDYTYDQLGDFGGPQSGRYGETSLGDGSYYIGYDYYDPFTRDTKKWYGVSDCESRINLNKAKYKEISAVIRITADIDKKDADDIAAAVVDWRDADDFPLINGAESHYYMSLNPPYKSKNSDFEVISELLLVRGITMEIYKKILPYVTIYGTGKVNINTARETVLTALGINKALAKKIIKYRKGVDREEGTYDDNVFTVPGSVTAELSQVVPISSEEAAVLSNLSSADIISTSSSAFNIRSVGRVGKRAQVLEIVCVFDRTMVENGENAIKFWREGYLIDPLPEGDQ